jgi:site-specific recombinase XerD
MVTSARTQEGYARDLAAFLNFLWLARGQRSWRDAGEADHLAYLQWRRRDSITHEPPGYNTRRECH